MKKQGKCALCGVARSSRWYNIPDHLKEQIKYESSKICELDYTRNKQSNTPVVTKSTIPNAGNGLFADRDYKWNEIITYYDGKEYALDDPNLPEDKSYFKQCGRYLIDGRVNFGNALGRYINSPAKGSRVNVRWGSTNLGTRIAIRALNKPKGCKDPIAIKAGQELFITYGPGYWAAIKKRRRERILKRKDRKERLYRVGFLWRKYKRNCLRRKEKL